ncbi:MAG: hypothetical protein HZC48_00430 [Nitrospirae bacterium]|nr:hypothetical protein [Nitrospirota bacterium]
MTPKRTKRKKRWALAKFGLTLYLALGMFALIGLRTAVVNLEYHIGDLNKQKVVLIRKSKALSAQRAGFYSSKMIEDVAMQKLGMTLPERQNVFFVKRETGASPYKASMTVPVRR